MWPQVAFGSVSVNFLYACPSFAGYPEAFASVFVLFGRSERGRCFQYQVVVKMGRVFACG